MIDPLTEVIVWPRGATKLYQKTESGKHVHVSLVYRHMQRGCRGVVLESIRTPRLATSREAVARFFRRLTEASQPVQANESSAASGTLGAKEVERELDRLGL